MDYNPNIHHRRSIRLKEYDYSQNGLYFVTICTNNQTHFFGEIVDGEMCLSIIGKIVGALWHEIKNHVPNVKLHEFIVMPNHVHGIIEITNHVAIQNDNVAVGARHAPPLQVAQKQH